MSLSQLQDEIFKHRNLRNYEKAFELFQEMENPKPLETLFEFSIINYYLPLSKKMPFPEFFQTILLPLLNCENQNFVNTTLLNLKFYTKPLKVLAEYDFSKSFEKLARNKMDTFYHSNPCIYYDFEKDCYGLNIRCVNYSILPNGVYKMLDDKLITLNKHFLLDKETFLPKKEQILENILPEETIDKEKERIQGYEDMRIFNGKKTIGSYFINNKIRIVTGNLCTETNVVNINKIWETENPVEKNWVYLNDKYLIYSWYPNLVLISLDSGNVQKIDTSAILPSFFRMVKGSTCCDKVVDPAGVSDSNEYWVCLHFNSNTVPRIYYNLVMVFEYSENAGLKIKKYSTPFKLEPDGNIEFCLGMIVEKEKNRIIFSASQNDSSAKVYVCDINSLNFLNF